MPPRPVVQAASQLEQRPPFPCLSDTEEIEQPLEVGLLDANSARFHTADLGLRSAKMAARRWEADVAAFTQRPQLTAQEAMSFVGPRGRVRRRCHGDGHWVTFDE